MVGNGNGIWTSEGVARRFKTVQHTRVIQYRIYSHNLRTFFPSLASEKSGCVKYAKFFCGGVDLGFILV
jgi:hypothetical protein